MSKDKSNQNDIQVSKYEVGFECGYKDFEFYVKFSKHPNDSDLLRYMNVVSALESCLESKPLSDWQRGYNDGASKKSSEMNYPENREPFYEMIKLFSKHRGQKVI